MSKTTFRNLLCLFILTLFSCENHKKHFSYIESQPSFFDLKHEDWTKNEWIRNPKNLKMVHETFKKIGYDQLEKFITQYEESFIIRGVFIKRNFDILLDSLVLTYQQNDAPKYYQEFWERRKKEKNEALVHEILLDYQKYKADKKALTFDNQYTNDTLFHLLKIETGNIDAQKAVENFETLRKFGFHQSAYNLLYERPEYDEIEMDRKKLETKLTTSKVAHSAWMEDNTP